MTWDRMLRVRFYANAMEALQNISKPARTGRGQPTQSVDRHPSARRCFSSAWKRRSLSSSPRRPLSVKESDGDASGLEQGERSELIVISLILVARL